MKPCNLYKKKNTSVVVGQQKETQELFRGIPSPEEENNWNSFSSQYSPKNFSVLKIESS